MSASFAAKAQEQPTQFMEWDPKPKVHPVPPKYFKEHAVVLLQSEKRDYKFDGNRGVTMYSTVHRIVKVLDKHGIEDFNTITVPFVRNESRVDSVKARVILPDGTTRDVKYEMLYIHSGGLFFALDGMEKNAEVEILVKYKSISSYFGSVYFQYNIPVLNTYFELNYPKELVFNLKSYHGFPAGQEQIVHGHKQVKIYQPEIPALENEKFSFYNLYRMRLEYGIDHFISLGGYQNGEPYTYDKMAQEMYTRFYDKNVLDKRIASRNNIGLDKLWLKESEKKSISKFLTLVGIRGGESDREKIKKIENGIKTEITNFWELSGGEGENLDTIVAKKIASPEGVVKLFAACFRTVGINHELGKVSDRTEHLMDSKFINWAPLEDYVFYFPDFNSYLAPCERYYRFPELPYSMINNKGVFTRTNPDMGYVVGTSVTEGDAIIRKITPNDDHMTVCNTTTEISVSNDLNVTSDITRSYLGYNAADLRLAIAKAPHDKVKDIVYEETELARRPEDLIRFSTSNESFNVVYNNKPLIVNAIVRTPYLVEKAGDRCIINVGQAIGQQPALYDEKERILPVDLAYPETNNYTITVNLPEGYKLADVTGLRRYIEESDKDNGNTIAYFKSDYTVTGNKLVVTVTESFPKIHYSVREYNEFRKLMIAAADFNKGVVVLDKLKPKKVVRKHKPATVTTIVTTTQGAAPAVKTAAPAAKGKPVVNAKPAPVAKPTAAAKATPVTKPVPVAQPAPAAQPQQNRPVSVINPAPHGTAKPAAKPAPVVKPAKKGNKA